MQLKLSPNVEFLIILSFESTSHKTVNKPSNHWHSANHSMFYMPLYETYVIDLYIYFDKSSFPGYHLTIMHIVKEFEIYYK